MSLRRKRFLLWCLSILLMSASVIIIGLGAVLPAEVPAEHQKTTELVAETAPSSRNLPSLQALEPLMSLDLRKPLFDAPEPVVAVERPPSLNIRLAGTVIEPGRNLALLLTPDGKTELKGVGETTGGAEILRIQQDGVTVLFNGHEITLKIEKAQQQQG